MAPPTAGRRQAQDLMRPVLAVQAVALAGWLVTSLVSYLVSGGAGGTGGTGGTVGTGGGAVAQLCWAITAAATGALCVLAASRDRARRRAAVVWGLLGAAHVVAALGALDLRPGAPLGPHQDLVALAYAVPVLAATGLLVRVTSARWRGGSWAAAVQVLLGGLALGLTVLAPSGVDAALMLVTLACAVLAAAELSGWRPQRVLGWLSAGLVVVAGAQTLAARADTRAAGPLMLLGFAVVGLATGPLERSLSTGAAGNDRRRFTVARQPASLAALDIPTALVGTSTGLLLLALGGRTHSVAGAGAALATLVMAALRPLRGHGGPAAGEGDTDELTGLANRKAVSEVLASDGALAPGLTATDGEPWSGWTDRISVLLVDLDRFKEINEALGHETGDLILAQVGERLRAVLRPNQLLARLGGDEFAVVLPGAGAEPARRVAEALRAQLHEPVDVETPDGPQPVYVQASVGIATCLLPRGDPGDLLRQADVAVYAAKEAGTGIELFDVVHDGRGVARLQRISELRTALQHGDLEVFLQPQVDLATGALCGTEALARWRHPKDGVLLPAAFLPLAAQTGLMRPVAAIVVDLALSACAQWWSRGHYLPVSVNLTGDDLADPELTSRVPEILVEHGLPARALRIEVTEDVLLIDPARVSALLESWRTMGIAVALDDYGTGYSSLAHLRELPIDELKLDRVFVADLASRRTATIVRHTVAMAHGLGMRVVAEGIESQSTASALAAIGCDIGQGLYFGAAMDVSTFLDHVLASTTA